MLAALAIAIASLSLLVSVAFFRTACNKQEGLHDHLYMKLNLDIAVLIAPLDEWYEFAVKCQHPSALVVMRTF